MTPTITFLSATEIEALRADLLSRTGLDLETLRERGAQYRLSPEQSAILEEIEDLDFLAGK